MRDAESTLDQLISFCGDKIEEPDVLSMFGLTAQGQLLELSRAVLAGEVEKALRQLNELANHGKDLGRLLSDLLNHFRNLLIFQVSRGDLKMLEVSEAEAAALKEQAKMAGPEGLTRILEVLAEAEMRLRDAASKKILVEVALLKAIEARSAVSIDSLLKQLQNLRDGKTAARGHEAERARRLCAHAPRGRRRRGAGPAATAPPAASTTASTRRGAGPVHDQPAGVAAPGPGDLAGLWTGSWKRSAAPARSRAPTCWRRTRFRSRRMCSPSASTPSSRTTSAWWTTRATTRCCRPSWLNSAIRASDQVRQGRGAGGRRCSRRAAARAGAPRAPQPEPRRPRKSRACATGAGQREARPGALQQGRLQERSAHPKGPGDLQGPDRRSPRLTR